jgi:hypothetical protein
LPEIAGVEKVFCTKSVLDEFLIWILVVEAFAFPLVMFAIVKLIVTELPAVAGLGLAVTAPWTVRSGATETGLTVKLPLAISLL